MRKMRKFLLLVGDIILLYLALLAATWLGLRNFGGESLLRHILAFSFIHPLWLIVIYIFGFYDSGLNSKGTTLYSKLLAVATINVVIGIVLFYLVSPLGINPKTNLAVDIVIFTILFYAWRRIFFYFFSSHFFRNVCIVGINSHAQEIAHYILSQPSLGYKLRLFVDTASQPYSTKTGTMIISTDENLFQNLCEKNIDTVIIAEDTHRNHRLAGTLYDCLSAPIDFLSLPQAYEIIAQKIPIDHIHETWFLENLKQRNKTNYGKVRRILDFLIGLMLALIALPFSLLIALAIKINSRGPVFYRQERVGRKRKTFRLIKFRSMKQGAEKQGAVWAQQKDPRITKVGNFLRKSHLDELPQLINIIKGDLSLVGPRPERPEFVAQLEIEIPHYHLRHLIKPGLTGWAQIKFRYARTLMDSHEKLQYDLYYLKNRSLLLDLSILLKTFSYFFFE